jgi:integrase
VPDLEWPVIRLRESNPVALTLMEFNQLRSFDSYTLKQQRVVDIFVFMVLTGRRFSDVRKMQAREVKGVHWELVMQKDRRVHVVPLVGFAAGALDILKKYEYKLPIISDQKFRDYIKEAAKAAGLTRKVVKRKFAGANYEEKEMHFYEVISTHTAKKTCISVLYEVGWNTEQIMQFTGNKDRKIIEKHYWAKNVKSLEQLLINTNL